MQQTPDNFALIFKNFPEGHLLLKAGLLQQQDVHEALEIAETVNSPIDQVIVNSGFVSEKNLKNARQARQYIQQDIMVEALAIDGLREAARRDCDLDAALRYLGWGW